VLLSDIRQFELKRFTRQPARQPKGLRRDFIPRTYALSVHALVNHMQHLSSPAAYIADRLGRDLVASDHLKDVLRFPRRLVSVPQRVLLQVFTTRVQVPSHAIALPS